ncbi:hypothetical protein [Pseudoduganella albidiflava]|uniref:Uncharacterized protein n=1 Tax=Pseudoduganella albidiflava TaxID=321983 RepID=A0A411WW38_9BURK|nr:hypothetical protein [Pseudoduganella albidiflava]QBI00970.1 hypothetical protein EYF70_09025 [Pseudoduganella albidiflava]GGY61075.1 hypothetical protein GCM10007387_49690 [Pseudoduganella albidiflava]
MPRADPAQRTKPGRGPVFLLPAASRALALLECSHAFCAGNYFLDRCKHASQADGKQGAVPPDAPAPEQGPETPHAAPGGVRSTPQSTLLPAAVAAAGKFAANSSPWMYSNYITIDEFD